MENIMSIGLFLDVDKTLTRDFIQKQYAIHLNVVEEYNEIENEFKQTQKSDIFGEKIIKLFRKKKFTESIAKSLFNKIELHEWTYELKNLPVEKYLVSSGPSYYIHNLAKELNIPEDNVLCSIYKFDKEDDIIKSCLPVNANSKANFVLSKKKKHVITIGIGDDELNDGPFICNCDLPILTNKSNNYFTLPQTLEPLFLFLGNIQKNKTFVSKNIRCFIGSTSERVKLATKLQGILQEYDCIPDLWKNMFEDRKTAIENLENISRNYDFAIYFITPDDLTLQRNDLKPAVRDNIIFEVGLFYGSIGRNRCFLLAPSSLDFNNLPSDLKSITIKKYNDNLSEDIKNMLTPVVDDIYDEMKKIGVLKHKF